MAYLLVFAICFALILSSFSLHKYGNLKRQHPFVLLAVFTAWSFSFLIVFTIPLDVTSTVYRQCLHEHNTAEINQTLEDQQQSQAQQQQSPHQECQKPWGMVPEHVFPNLWRVIYWSSQMLTWLIMPLMQSYLKAGDFSFKGKLKSALIDNAIYYGSYLLICGILLIYIALKPDVFLDWPKLKAIASSASNTWGLFLLVLLLGYALVEVPRSLWNNSKPGFTLTYAYFKSAKLSTDKAEAEENVDDVLDSLHAVNRAIPTTHELRYCVETILRKVPVELLEKASRQQQRNDISTTIIPSEKALVRLHKQVIKSLQTLQRTEALWTIQVNKIFHLEDVARNQLSMDRRFKCEFQKTHRSHLARLLYSPTFDWYWQCLLKPPFLKILAIITGVLSLMVVWSELTFFNRYPVLSIFANVLNLAKNHYDFLTIELFSMLTLCYLCYCAYSTIFRIKFLNLYYLAPHHQTNEHSLIFSGMLLCRLTPPMCLNFLGLIHMDSHIIKKRIFETYYTQVMGHMDVIGIISDGFNIYFPMVMLAFCLATWFSIGSRTLNALGFQQFMLNETISVELVQEGRDLISREKRKRQRLEESMLRRKDLNRMNSNTTSGGGGGIVGSIGGGNVRDNNSIFNKYRSGGGNGNGGGSTMSATLGPDDGLLRNNEPIDYFTNSSNERIVTGAGGGGGVGGVGIDSVGNITRSLSEEINERFGASTHVQVGFRGYDMADSNSDDDVESMRRSRQPPTRLFDDV